MKKPSILKVRKIPDVIQLHGRRAGNGLGHRRNAIHRVERHGFGLIDRSYSESAFVNEAVIIGGERDDPWNEARFDRLPQDFVYSRC